MEIFWNITNVFGVTLDQFNAVLRNKKSPTLSQCLCKVIRFSSVAPRGS